jgi:non-ribosomal peptide synthetase component E (peptide arylation enzyme)
MNAVEYCLLHGLKLAGPEHPAILCAQESLSYGELAARVSQFAAGLRGAGVRPSDRVDARWFALNRKVKLSAAAGGASGHGSAPWLSIWAECRLDFKTMHHGQRNGARFPSRASGYLSIDVSS